MLRLYAVRKVHIMLYQAPFRSFHKTFDCPEIPERIFVTETDRPRPSVRPSSTVHYPVRSKGVRCKWWLTTPALIFILISTKPNCCPSFFKFFFNFALKRLEIGNLEWILLIGNHFHCFSLHITLGLCWQWINHVICNKQNVCHCPNNAKYPTHWNYTIL